MSDSDKRLAAEAAVAEVRDGMLVGLGTGSTAAFAIEAIGARVREGLGIRAVATSDASTRQAEALGIPLLDMADVAQVDLTIDGADEIDSRLFAIKGAGGAMLREKIVAAASARMIVVADGSKRVDAIGAKPLPVEVLPFAQAYVASQLAALGATPELRRAGLEPYRTDSGNLVLDCHFPSMPDPQALDRALNALPGVIGHGLFLHEIDAAYISSGGSVTKVERKA